MYKFQYDMGIFASMIIDAKRIPKCSDCGCILNEEDKKEFGDQCWDCNQKQIENKMEEINHPDNPNRW